MSQHGVCQFNSEFQYRRVLLRACRYSKDYLVKKTCATFDQARVSIVNWFEGAGV
jgi:hypothetical protein